MVKKTTLGSTPEGESPTESSICLLSLNAELKNGIEWRSFL